MIKLDNQGRLFLSKDIRKISGFNFSKRIYYIYDRGNIILRDMPNWGVDKVVGILKMDSQGRVFLRSMREQFDLNPDTSLIVWAEPGAIHIERRDLCDLC